MALYTKLSKKQISSIISHFGLSTPKKIKGVLEGTVNTYYQLSYLKETYFLKIDEIGDRGRLKRELKILDLLGDIKNKLPFKTPIPLKTNKGMEYLPFEKKFILLFKKLHGQSPMPRPNKYQLFQIGKSLALMHKATQNKKLPPHRFFLPELMKVYHEIEIRLKKKHPHLAKEIWVRLKEYEKGKHKIPSGLIHADLFPENILFEHNKITGILDFESAGFGPFLFDIATTLHACCYNGNNLLLLEGKQFLKGYESIRKITAKEWKNFEHFLNESCLRFLLTRLRGFELKEGPVMASPFKDYREYSDRFQNIPNFVRGL